MLGIGLFEMGALVIKDKEANFRTGFMTEAGTKTKSTGYFGTAEQAGLACWIVAERVDAYEAKDSAKIAVERILENFAKHPTLAKAKIREYLFDAHQKLKDESKMEMLKASLVMVVTDYSKVVWAVVGNVRLYHFRSGEFTFRSKDQTIAQLMVDSGLLAEEDVNHREERNNLINYLGGITEFKPFISEPFRIQDGDVLLLCNSGVWERMSNKEITDILEQTGDPDDFLSRLKTAALARGNSGIKNYSMGAIFTQQTSSKASGVDYRKIIPKKLQKPLLRDTKSDATTNTKSAPHSQHSVSEKAGKNNNSGKSPKRMNSEHKNAKSVAQTGQHFPISSQWFVEQIKTIKASLSVMDEKKNGKTQNAERIRQAKQSPPQNSKVPNIKAKRTEKTKKGSPKSVSNSSQAPLKIQKVTTKAYDIKLPDFRLLVRTLGTGLEKLPARWLRLDKRMSRNMLIYVLGGLVSIGVIGLFVHQIRALQAQKALELQRQIRLTQQRTVADQERCGDQMASYGQYQAAAKEYQAALAILQKLHDPEHQTLINKKWEITKLIISGDNYLATGKYEAALQAYAQANPNAAGFDCLQSGLTKKIAWTQQMLSLLSLEGAGDQAVSQQNYIGAKAQYQSALSIANQIAVSDQITALITKLAKVEQKIVEKAAHDAAIAARNAEKQLEEEKRKKQKHTSKNDLTRANKKSGGRR